MRNKTKQKNKLIFIVLFLIILQIFSLSVAAYTTYNYDDIFSKNALPSTIQDILDNNLPDSKNDTTNTPNGLIKTPTDPSTSDNPPDSTTPSSPDKEVNPSDNSKPDCVTTISSPPSPERIAAAIVMAEKTQSIPEINGVLKDNVLTLSISTPIDASTRVSVLGQTITPTASTIEVPLPTLAASLPYVLVVETLNGVSFAQYVPLQK